MNVKKKISRRLSGIGEQYFALLSKVKDLSPALQMQFILMECFFKTETQVTVLSKKRIIKTLQNFMTKLEQDPAISNSDLRYLVQVQLNNRQVQKIKLLKSVFEFFDKVILKSEHLANHVMSEEMNIQEAQAIN